MDIRLFEPLLDASPTAHIAARRSRVGAPTVTYANASARALLQGENLGAPLARLAEMALVSRQTARQPRVTFLSAPGRCFRASASPIGDDAVAIHVVEVTAEIRRRDLNAAWVDVVDDRGTAAWIFDRSTGVPLPELPLVAASPIGRTWSDTSAGCFDGSVLHDILGGAIDVETLEHLRCMVDDDRQVPLTVERRGARWSGSAWSRGPFLTVRLDDDGGRQGLLAAVQQNVQFLSAAQTDLLALGRVVQSHIEPMLSRAETHDAHLAAALKAGDVDQALADLDGRGRSLARVGSILGELRTFARINTATATNDAIQLGDVFDDVVERMRPYIGEVGASVTRRRLPTIWGRSDLWPIVFGHLVRNALAFARPGVPVRVRATALRRDDAWHIEIADNGAGVPPRFLDRIFEPLFQIEPRAEAGCGLGLAICRRAVEHHLGRIEAESVVGEGTTIRIELPARPMGTSVDLF